ncbi:hypothetical protein ILU99_002964 [Salmonella enterica]|nr:hypothetical protein [Salmonella enterica]ECC9415173.1 hypothetical protein [Salmonella enterica subsp. enterica]EHF4824710.1 hypothetical protein [Salmonella enterica subsp. enterica serovar 4,5,12:b:-]EHG1579493.1 hypothetical protein [Salmonella enterica subsp. enterica serovar 4,[5],12:b:-]EHJ5011186.1 hypothetical protein [Salmonella enterica subsp. enterica serovar Saintpaul]
MALKLRKLRTAQNEKCAELLPDDDVLTDLPHTGGVEYLKNSRATQTAVCAGYSEKTMSKLVISHFKKLQLRSRANWLQRPGQRMPAPHGSRRSGEHILRVCKHAGRGAMTGEDR